MPVTMLNESQTVELIEALEDAVRIAHEKKTDASVMSIGSNSWVACDTPQGEYYDQTLIRVCFTDPEIGYENPQNKKKYLRFKYYNNKEPENDPLVCECQEPKKSRSPYRSYTCYVKK